MPESSNPENSLSMEPEFLLLNLFPVQQSMGLQRAGPSHTSCYLLKILIIFSQNQLTDIELYQKSENS